MSLLLPEGLPARRLLAAERVPLATAGPQPRGAERPLRVMLINLMPAKAATETQLARLLGHGDAAVELTLALPDGYRPRTAAPEHIAAFYRPWSELSRNRYDGLIVTGAPVETLPFEAVRYWPALTRILDWAESHVGSAYLICWAAQAALYHYHGVPKHVLPAKRFGVYRQRVRASDSPLLAGFAGGFAAPVSRHAETRAADLPGAAGLTVLADSEASGPCLIEDAPRRFLYMFNHLEYDADTLAREYRRDLAAGLRTPLPEGYFPGGDAGRRPRNRWRRHGRLLFRNWIEAMRREARRAG